MTNDLQRAGMWKRIAAGLFDAILTSMLAVGLACLLSMVLGYDGYSRTLEEAYEAYEAQYGVDFSVSQAEYAALTPEVRQKLDDAYAALTADEAVMKAYSMTINLMAVITTAGILLAMLVTEFLVPLRFGDGRTLGKKIFGLCLMRTDGVALNRMQLFARTVLGKFTVETMVPICIVFMIFWGILDFTGTLILFGLLTAQLLLLALTRTNAMIHDLIAGTVVVDYASQKIFRTTEDLIAYQAKIAAERSARQTY